MPAKKLPTVHRKDINGLDLLGHKLTKTNVFDVFSILELEMINKLYLITEKKKSGFLASAERA